MSAERRLRELAKTAAIAAHVSAVENCNESADGHRWRNLFGGGYEFCPHPDCVLVHSAFGDTGRATPAKLEVKCAWCGEDIRFIDGEWLDRDTHSTCDRSDEAVVKHAPAALPQEIEQSIAELTMAKDLLRQVGTDPEVWIDGVIDRLAAVRAPSGEGREPIACANDVTMLRTIADIFARDSSEGLNLPGVARVIHRVLAASRHSQGWQDIETAPKDGTNIVLGWSTMVLGGYWADWRGQKAWVTSRGEYHGSDAPTHWQPLPAPPGSGDGPPQTSELEKAWRDGYETHVRGARNIEKAWTASRYAKTQAGAGAVPPPCESDCNPYVATCGARFCTDEARQQHELTCGAVPPPEELR